MKNTMVNRWRIKWWTDEEENGEQMKKKMVNRWRRKWWKDEDENGEQMKNAFQCGGFFAQMVHGNILLT